MSQRARRVRTVTATTSAVEPSSSTKRMLGRRGLTLEYITLSWNVIGTVVVITAALAAGSVALAGFGLDSLIEIGASVIVVWQLKSPGDVRERKALRLIGGAFIALAFYIAAQAAYTLLTASHPQRSELGIIWTVRPSWRCWRSRVPRPAPARRFRIPSCRRRRE